LIDWKNTEEGDSEGNYVQGDRGAERRRNVDPKIFYGAVEGLFKTWFIWKEGEIENLDRRSRGRELGPFGGNCLTKAREENYGSDLKGGVVKKPALSTTRMRRRR